MRYPAIPQVVRGCSCFRGVKLYFKGGEGKKKSREIAKKFGGGEVIVPLE